MNIERNQVREGMTVYSSDGEKLGKVLSCDATSFTIEKGFFFPKDYVARFEDVADVTGDEIRLSTTKDRFIEGRQGGWSGEGTATTASAGTGTRGSRTTDEDVRMPVAEEELDVVKRDREAGEVRLRKDVVHETKRIDVPVTREEVRVERVPVSEGREATGDRTFERDSVAMPIHEEELEVRKRPVVKEEVRLRKERVTEQRAAEADVRKERVEVEGERGTYGISEEPAELRRDLSDSPPIGAPRRDDDLD